MQPRSERFTTRSLDGVELHTLQWGEPGARSLILLHGGGANAHWWDHLAPAWSRHMHTVALDFRGHGDSDYPEELIVGAFNDDLEALLEHLDAEEVFLVGHSMGGGVALDHAARHPATRGLVLLDVARGATRRSKRTARLALTFRRSYKSREAAIDRYRFLPTAAHASEELRASIAAHSVREEPDGRFGFKFDPRWFGLPSRPRPELSRIACPTLLVRGAESALLSQDGAQAFVEELPEARLLEVDAAGHHVHLDRPDLVGPAVDGFLAEL